MSDYHESAPPQEGPGATSASEQVRCEVTGKLVRREDSVEFQGKIVSEEGKRILLERLYGNEADAVSKTLRRPSFWRRFLCFLLDCLIVSGVMAVLNYAILGVTPGDSQSDVYNPREVMANIFSGSVSFLYYWFMQAKYGQTVGKMAGAFRVVNMDGTPIDDRTSLVRAFWSDGYYTLLLVVVYFAPDMYIAVSIIVLLFVLASCLSLVADREYNRALHDRFAGTRTVMDPER